MSEKNIISVPFTHGPWVCNNALVYLSPNHLTVEKTVIISAAYKGHTVCLLCQSGCVLHCLYYAS